MSARTQLAIAAAGVLVLTATACEEEASPGAPPSRVVAVAAEDPDARPLEELCYFFPAEAEAPAFAAPAVDAPEAPTPGRWRWLNVWATWCAPCVEELPLIGRFAAELEAEGRPIDLRFVSSDQEPEAVDRFRVAHPDAPASARMQDPASLTTWVTTVGLDQGAALPVHVFVDPDGRVRCARGGAISERDLVLVRRLVAP